jgi:hypothetical protein
MNLEEETIRIILQGYPLLKKIKRLLNSKTANQTLTRSAVVTLVEIVNKDLIKKIFKVVKQIAEDLVQKISS